MLVKFVLNLEPSFCFSSSDVPAEHCISYGAETDIFDFLNSRLTPSDVIGVECMSDGVNSRVVLVYNIDDLVLLDMPSFEPIPFEPIEHCSF